MMTTFSISLGIGVVLVAAVSGLLFWALVDQLRFEKERLLDYARGPSETHCYLPVRDGRPRICFTEEQFRELPSLETFIRALDEHSQTLADEARQCADRLALQWNQPSPPPTVPRPRAIEREVPNYRELFRSLPRWARVAFAVRCGFWLLSFLERNKSDEMLAAITGFEGLLVPDGGGDGRDVVEHIVESVRLTLRKAERFAALGRAEDIIQYPLRFAIFMTPQSKSEIFIKGSFVFFNAITDAASKGEWHPPVSEQTVLIWVTQLAAKHPILGNDLKVLHRIAGGFVWTDSSRVPQALFGPLSATEPDSQAPSQEGVVTIGVSVEEETKRDTSNMEWRKRLCDALSRAFNPPELTQLLKLEMDIDFTGDVAPDTLPFFTRVFHLIKWVVRHRREKELARAAAKARPNNKELYDIFIFYQIESADGRAEADQ